MQELFDMANYTVEAKNAEEVVQEVKETLSNYFSQKQAAATVSFFLSIYNLHSFSSKLTSYDRLKLRKSSNDLKIVDL